MKSFTPRIVAAIVLPAIVLLNFVSPAIAQPNLSSLWPVDVGREWVYDVVVQSPSQGTRTGSWTLTVVSQTEVAPGVTEACFNILLTGPAVAPAAMPEGQSALDQRPWFSRPGLLQKISTQNTGPTVAQPFSAGPFFVPVYLLAVPYCNVDTVFRVDDSVAMGVWGGSPGDWDWWWIPANPVPGSSFRLQLNPETSDDQFLNGVVRTIDGSVTTAAGSFTNAVIVDYVVELGQSTIVDAGGGIIGTMTAEVRGWVAFVPDVGPVASEEAFVPVQVDCPTCPPETSETITTTQDLRSMGTVPNEVQSFGSLKARY